MKTKTTLIVAGGFALAALSSMSAGEAGTKLKQMDTDGDGRVSRAEHAAAALAAFGKLDTNSDGIVTAEERAAGQEKKSSKLKFWEKDKDDTSSLSPTGKLDQADQNSDGQITRAENETFAEARFTALDADKDGALVEKELAAADAEPAPAKDDKPARTGN